ncbi:MAG: HAD-IA family hydrolase, partial [Myxococcota bacterium]|nr:HAD-IA family hydrolase [Myxococcota bacterium]
RGWVLGWFDGIPEVLTALRGRFGLAVFSNTNAVHWPDLQQRFDLEERVDRCFVSYQMGLAKPDREAFAYVASELGCAPGEILFLDDNRLNVAAAKEAGLQAAQAFGGDAVRQVLGERGLL